MDKEQHLLVGGAGDGVAGCDLQEVQQVVVATGGIVQRLLPQVGSRRSVILHGGQLSEQVFAAVRAQLARGEIDDAIEAIEQPRVGVELRLPDWDAGLAASQDHHGIDCGSGFAGDSVRHQ